MYIFYGCVADGIQFLISLLSERIIPRTQEKQKRQHMEHVDARLTNMVSRSRPIPKAVIT